MLMMAGGLLLAPWSAGAQTSGWTKIPTLTILGAENDPRVPLVREAVDFWNRIFAEIETPFRLGEVGIQPGEVSGSELKRLSEQVLSRTPGAALPAAARAAPGDLVVVLSDADFVSFAGRWPGTQKRMVAIKSRQAYPFTLPNVMRNVIAHELGHAIGLGHNSDPANLMCGRPNPCRPDAFSSRELRYFPITKEEKEQLRKFYPADWKPS